MPSPWRSRWARRIRRRTGPSRSRSSSTASASSIPTVEVGYLHRGFEKECESGEYYQAVPYTDRLNYASPMINNVGYCLAAEKLFGITVPPRGQYLRTLACELSRMSDHFTCIGASALEIAAMTPFLYSVQARELIWDLHEALCGARVTTNYVRIGGLQSDLPPGFADLCRQKLADALALFADVDALLTTNPIFRERMEGTGALPAATLIAYGVTGPLLRAAGVPLDLRRTPTLPGLRSSRLRRAGRIDG